MSVPDDTRRTLLRLGVVLGGAAVIMARPWSNFGSEPLEFEPISRIAPLRRLTSAPGGVAGSVSGGGAGQAILFGLDDPLPAVDPATAERVASAFGTLLWGDWQDGGPVPITYFTDIRCPICSVLERRLGALGANGATASRLTTREFPLLGEGSTVAARAILAAGAQGAAEQMRARLKRSPVVITQAALAQIVEGMALDRAAFEAALVSAEITARLDEDIALARHLGLPGTPGLVVGRTRIIGLLSDAALADLTALEAAEGPPERA